MARFLAKVSQESTPAELTEIVEDTVEEPFFRCPQHAQDFLAEYLSGMSFQQALDPVAGAGTLVAFNARRGFSVAPDAPLLVTRKHQRVSVRRVQRLFESLRERAGLDVPATPRAY